MIGINSVRMCGGDCELCERFSASKKSNEVVLVKKKVSQKYMPPDMSAIKLLNELDNVGAKSVMELSDEELKNLQKELLRELNNEKE